MTEDAAGLRGLNILTDFALVDIGNAPQIIELTAPCFGPAHRLPLQEISGHALPLFVRGAAIHIVGRLAPGDDQNCRQRAPGVPGQEQSHAVALAEKAPGATIVIEGVDPETGPLAGHAQQPIKVRQVVGGPLRNDDALALGKADVVAGLGLHLSQNIIFVQAEVDQYGSPGLH